MQRFISGLIYLVIAAVLIPSVSFSATIKCEDIPNAECRNVCKADEIKFVDAKVMEGEHKGIIVRAICDNNGKTKTKTVCCVKKITK